MLLCLVCMVLPTKPKACACWQTFYQPIYASCPTRPTQVNHMPPAHASNTVVHENFVLGVFPSRMSQGKGTVKDVCVYCLPKKKRRGQMSQSTIVGVAMGNHNKQGPWSCCCYKPEVWRGKNKGKWLGWSPAYLSSEMGDSFPGVGHEERSQFL